MKWLLFLVVCITLLVTVWSSSEHFSITEFKGGPTHESILLSAFDEVFLPKGEELSKFSERTVFGSGPAGKQTCRGFMIMIENDEHYRDYYKNKDVSHLRCAFLHRYPSIFQLLTSGARWNDMPCFEPRTPWTPCLTNFVRKFTSAENAFENGYLPEKTEKGYDVVSQSHFGENQYYHAMAPTGKDFKSVKITNSEVREKMLSFARHNWEHACNAKHHPWALTYIARLLHMVQDSYSEAHVHRAKPSDSYQEFLNRNPKYKEKGEKFGDIIFFQGYDAQDHKKHAAIEGMFPESTEEDSTMLTWIRQGIESIRERNLHKRKYSFSDVHGAVAARDRCVRIWKFWKETLDKTSDSLVPSSYDKCMKIYDRRVEPYLRYRVFKFAKVQCEGESEPRDAGSMYAGGSTKDFISEESKNIKLPCGGQYVSKETVDRHQQRHKT